VLQENRFAKPDIIDMKLELFVPPSEEGGVVALSVGKIGQWSCIHSPTQTARFEFLVTIFLPKSTSKLCFVLSDCSI